MRTQLLAAGSALLMAALGCSGEAGSPVEPGATARPPMPDLAIASDTWIARADMLQARSDVAAVTVKNGAGQSVLYAIGGYYSGAIFNTVQVYNATLNTWAKRTPLPEGRHTTNGAGAINGKIYISGGFSGSHSEASASLYVYSPATNTWTRKHDMPIGGYAGVTGVINGKLYVLTGCDLFDYCNDHVPQAFYRYDPATDSWLALPQPAHTHVFWGMAGVIGGRFYVVGGGDRALDVYDPATNRWTTKASMASNRTSGAGIAVGGKLYVIGGRRQNVDGSTEVVRTTSVYNPVTNTWTNKARLPTARSSVAAGVVVVGGQSRIELVGGSPPGNNLQYIP